MPFPSGCSRGVAAAVSAFPEPGVCDVPAKIPTPGCAIAATGCVHPTGSATFVAEEADGKIGTCGVKGGPHFA